MLKSKAIAAGAIALTLTLGGGVLWSSQYANAAAASTTQTDQKVTEKAADGTIKKGKGGQFGRGLGKIQDELQTYLGLDEAALQTQLKTSTLSEIAVAQGKTRDELKAKLVEWLKAEQASAPAPAADTDEKSDGQAARTKPDASELAEKLLDAKGGEQGFGKHGRGGMGFGVGLESVATALGLGSEELKEALADGKTIATLAAEKGVAVQTVIDAQVSAMKTKLAEKLAAGELTQEQYDTRLAEATEHVTKLVNGELPDRAQGGGKGQCGGDKKAEEAATTSESEASA